MADNNKKYDLDNFDTTKVYGKHFKDDEPVTKSYSDQRRSRFGDDFVIDETRVDSFDSSKHETAEYGDDFYSDASNFENEEHADDFDTYDSYNSYQDRNYNSNRNNDNDKKKNIIITVLVITLAIVVFLFGMIVFITRSDKDDKKETKPTKASETVQQTEEQAPTFEEVTQAPVTDAPVTQAPITQAPTTPPMTEAPVIDNNDSGDSGFDNSGNGDITTDTPVYDGGDDSFMDSDDNLGSFTE